MQLHVLIIEIILHSKGNNKLLVATIVHILGCILQAYSSSYPQFYSIMCVHVLALMSHDFTKLINSIICPRSVREISAASFGEETFCQ